MATEAGTENTPERGDDAFSGEELRRIAEEISSAFPPPRLGTELVLLDVDPLRAHAYWNIDLEDYRDARLDSGSESSPLILRMYDVTSAELDENTKTPAFEVEIQGLQGHWYVDLAIPGRRYAGEIGFRRVDGSLAFIARSNVVQTPQSEQAPETTESPVELDVAESEPVVPADGTSVGAEGETPPPWPRLEVLSGENETVPDVAPIAPAGPWPDIPKAREDKPGVRERVEEFYSEMAVPGSAISRAESQMEKEIEGKRPEATPSPSPGPVPAPSESHAPSSPGPSQPVENYASWSNYDQGRQTVDLEINTELHIYGRAKPGSDLTLFGQKVQLRPDGTFSIRKPLPQGAVVIPLLFSSNGDAK